MREHCPRTVPFLSAAAAAGLTAAVVAGSGVGSGRFLTYDRGYDHDKCRRLVWALGVKPVIARRGTEHGSGLGTQRWFVERAFARLHWFRRP